MSGLDEQSGAAVGVETAQLSREPAVRQPEFVVRLTNFEGPFDLLLALIGRRKLDVTEIALAQVTDEFLVYMRSPGDQFDLGRTTQFLVVAATLLDLKAARLLPAAHVEDAQDVALLEARDLLFARLLQYRAYKLFAAHLGELMRRNARRYPRTVALEGRFAAVLPEVALSVGPGELAELAAQAMRPRPVPQVQTEHVHSPRVSVQEHMLALAERLADRPSATFAALVADCASTLEVVARFLGLLELYRAGSVEFDQQAALAELRIRWTGDEGAADTLVAGTATAAGGIDGEYG